MRRNAVELMVSWDPFFIDCASSTIASHRLLLYVLRCTKHNILFYPKHSQAGPINAPRTTIILGHEAKCTAPSNASSISSPSASFVRFARLDQCQPYLNIWRRHDNTRSLMAGHRLQSSPCLHCPLSPYSPSQYRHLALLLPLFYNDHSAGVGTPDKNHLCGSFPDGHSCDKSN